jgi:methylenetetrahydrofolate dehydrogenase (NADP+) / methenyltetrahydrofolate cyclohydrolase
MAIIFDGKALALKKEIILKKKVTKFAIKNGFIPKLAVMLVGSDPASQLYVRLKEKAALDCGFQFEKKIFSKDVEPQEVKKYIEEKNNDPLTQGILVQLPFPPDSKILNSLYLILNTIDPAKDIDCLTSTNFGLLAMGKPRFLPATVRGIASIIENWKTCPELAEGLKIENSNVVVVGASNIVGKPLAIWLSDNGATVTICRSKTRNLAEHTLKADLLICATGKPGLITRDMVKQKAIVIDVGSPKGDVDFENVKEIASFITPVPGGVGPMTVVSLLENML